MNNLPVSKSIKLQFVAPKQIKQQIKEKKSINKYQYGDFVFQYDKL